MTMELPRIHSGKVRDLYDAGDGRLVMVASDRVSAFDVIMAEPVTDKGRVLTAMTSFWCEEMADIVPGSQITADPLAMADALGGAALPPTGLAGLFWCGGPKCCISSASCGATSPVRPMRSTPAPGTVHGTPMPAGLQLASQLEEPIFTPSTKAVEGHDINIDFAGAVDRVGAEAALAAKQISLALYRRAAARCAEAGFVLADTKFELGYVDGVLCLCDEVCTPDSSRLWPAAEVVPGRRHPPSTSSPCATGWRRSPGTGRRRRPLCPTRSPRPCRPATSLRMSASPAAH